MISEEELKQVKLFKSVDLESIKGLIDACALRSMEEGEVLITAGQANRTVYFLLSGRVNIHLDSLDGEPVAVIGPGESVGEMSVIDRRPASAFVVAKEPTRLLAMEEDVLWSLVQSSHAAACNLLTGLTDRLRNANEAFIGAIDSEQDYRRFALLDALTGLHNRFWLEKILDRQIDRTVKGGEPYNLAVIMIDIDDFNAFNEQYGRAYGDHILSFVSKTISDNLRPTEIITRYGGDEFVIFLPDVGIDTARQISERVHRGIKAAVPVMPDGQTIPHPTVSLSVVMWQEGQTAKELLAEADRALSRAKNTGRDRISQ